MGVFQEFLGGAGPQVPAIVGTSSAIPFGTVGSVSAAHTVDGGANLLLVAIDNSRDGAITFGSVTWTPSVGSPQAMTQQIIAQSVISGLRSSIAIYTLVNPNPGAGTVDIVYSAGSPDNGRMRARNIAGADTASPLAATSQKDESNTTRTHGTVTLTTSAPAIIYGAGCVTPVLDAWTPDAGSIETGDGSQSTGFDNTNCLVYRIEPVPGAYAVGATVGVAGQLAFAGVAIKGL